MARLWATGVTSRAKFKIHKVVRLFLIVHRGKGSSFSILRSPSVSGKREEREGEKKREIGSNSDS